MSRGLCYPKEAFFLILFYFIDYTMVVVLTSPPIPPSTQHPPLPQAIPPTIVHVHVSCVGSLATPFPMLYFTSLWLFCNYLFVILNPLTSSPIPTHLVTIEMLWDPG